MEDFHLLKRIPIILTKSVTSQLRSINSKPYNQSHIKQTFSQNGQETERETLTMC